MSVRVTTVVIKNVLMSLEGFIVSVGLATSWWTCLPVKVS